MQKIQYYLLGLNYIILWKIILNIVYLRAYINNLTSLKFIITYHKNNPKKLIKILLFINIALSKAKLIAKSMTKKNHG